MNKSTTNTMQLEDLQKVFKQKEYMRRSADALDQGDELLALKYWRLAKMLEY
jgi:hypothetical protein